MFGILNFLVFGCLGSELQDKEIVQAFSYLRQLDRELIFLSQPTSLPLFPMDTPAEIKEGREEQEDENNVEDENENNDEEQEMDISNKATFIIEQGETLPEGFCWRGLDQLRELEGQLGRRSTFCFHWRKEKGPRQWDG